MDRNKTPPLPEIDRDKNKDSNKENEQQIVELTSNGGKIKSSTVQYKNLRKTATGPSYQDVSQPNKLTKLTINQSIITGTSPERPNEEAEKRMRVDPGKINGRKSGTDDTPMDEEESESPKRPHLDPLPKSPSPTNKTQETQETITKLIQSLDNANKQVKTLMRTNWLNAAKEDNFIKYLVIQLAENLNLETHQDSLIAILESIKTVSEKIDKLSQITKIDNLIVQDNLDTINRNHNKT
jgi:hypothetical protein